MSDEELVGVACAIGPMAAIALRQFEGTFSKKLLRDALCKLRDEWQDK